MNQDLKSQSDFCVAILLAALDDVATHLSYQTTDRWNDGRVIVRRTTAEGIGFVTNSLPSLGKALDSALSSDALFECPTGFKCRRDSRLPVFLGSLFEQVFDEFGIQRSDASESAVSCLRQILYLFYKLELPSSQSQIDETIQRFKQNEAELQHQVGPDLVSAQEALAEWKVNPFLPVLLVPSQIDLSILALARRLVCAVLAYSDPKDEKFRPKHGPGAVATGEKDEEKMIFKRYFPRLAEEFPYEIYFFYNLTHLCDELHCYLSLDESQEPTAKVVLVPKDSRGPRLISCEPLEIQWVQQMLMANMVQTIESHPVTSGYVNFTDQGVNRRLALRGSTRDSNHLVTLDMKDASDRVHSHLVRILFPETWVKALMASRSTATRLPNGEVVQLEKFAPMGSATCFPTEALIFWALSTATVIDNILSEHPIEGAWKGVTNVLKLSQLLALLRPGTMHADLERSVYVYGDDIILHRKDYPAVERTFNSVGLRLNKNKCCVGATFRESCGCDAYKGVDVTPLRMKATWSHRPTPKQIVSLVAFQHALVERAWYTTAIVLSRIVAERIQLPLIRLERDRQGLAQVGPEYLHWLLPDDHSDALLLPTVCRIRTRTVNGRRKKQMQVFVVRSPSKYVDGASCWGEILRKESSRAGLTSKARIALNQKVRRPPTPVGADTSLRKWAASIGPIAKACWYTSARQVSLRRVWVNY